MEVSAQLQALQGQLGMLVDPHTITDEEVGLSLVPSLPHGKTGQSGPHGAAKFASSKSIEAAEEVDSCLESSEDELNSIHKSHEPSHVG